MPAPLTTIGKEIALLSEEVLARVKALRADVPLLTYRVQIRCTLRSGPSMTAAILARLGPTLASGAPRLLTGRPYMLGWVEVVVGVVVQGYVKAGALRALPARAAR